MASQESTMKDVKMFLNNFIKKAIVVNNACNTIYCAISNMLAVGSH